jgi:hypothetical protein
MAGGGHHHGGGDHTHGAMDIKDHQSTFSGFMKVAEWGSVLTVMSVAFLVFAFAMNLGWWTGLIVYVIIGAIAGAVMKMGGAWWATLAISTVLLGVGGAITMGLLALAGG